MVLAIQHNADLDHNLNEMDIKIGLLVKNRISLQDVEKHNRQLKKARKRGSLKDLDAVLAGQQANGLKSLTKDAREKLESYQHLFYLLQVHGCLVFRPPRVVVCNWEDLVRAAHLTLCL